MEPKPVRIQRKRTRGFSLQGASPNGLPVVYCGRPSRWKNFYRIGDGFPLPHSKPLTRIEAVEVFEGYLKANLLDISIADVKRELRGKNLACWCKLSEPCHADILLEIANQ